MSQAVKAYIELWWMAISAARGPGKKVRLDSDRMTIEIERAFTAGWQAHEKLTQSQD